MSINQPFRGVCVLQPPPPSGMSLSQPPPSENVSFNQPFRGSSGQFSMCKSWCQSSQKPAGQDFFSFKPTYSRFLCPSTNPSEGFGVRRWRAPGRKGVGGRKPPPSFSRCSNTPGRRVGGFWVKNGCGILLFWHNFSTVSYTHLTLPTILRV